MSSGFKGTVQAAPTGLASQEPPSGPIHISIDDRGRVTGNLKIGARPNFALTGFSGMRQGNQILAQGRNRRTAGGVVYDLEVAIEGDIASDGKSISGVVGAWLNVPELERAETPPKLWSFSVTLEAGPPVELAKPTEADLGAELPPEAPEIPVEEPSLWARIPSWAKTGGIAAGVIVGGITLYKRLR